MTAEAPGEETRPASSHAPSRRAALELRARVLDELSVVQGRIALASKLDPNTAKEQLRIAHSAQRAARLAEVEPWLNANQDRLLMEFANGDEIDPAAIDPVVIPVRTPRDVDLFKYTSLQWSVPVSNGYGRRSRFLVRDRQNGKLMAIFALGDPVIAQSARDSMIGWSTAQRNKRLYNVYDAYVLGAVEPYRQLLGGKLAALLTISNDVRDFLTEKYAGNTSVIRKEQKDPTPVLITTSSALGRSSVYNRITFEGSLMFHSVGFTKGFGHFQFSDELFAQLREFVRESVLDDRDAKVQSTVYGSGPNWRFRVIRTALKALDIPEDSLQHNVKREVFLAPTASNWDSFLRGESNEPVLFDLPADAIGKYYRERWAVPRAERMPEFAEWRREQGRIIVEPAASPSTGAEDSASAGVVDLGAYQLRVGTGAATTRGTTPGGVNTDGQAYFSSIRGEGIHMELADIIWANGEREVRGWDRLTSPPEYQAFVGRLRIGVHAATRFRSMSVAEMRTTRPSDSRSPQAHKTSAGELSELFGFDVGVALDRLSEAMVGTRAELLRDESTRRGQLSVVFPDADRITPAVIWALLRPIAFALQSGPGAAKPSAPRLVVRPPRIEDLTIA